jgi:hypothetical protein
LPSADIALTEPSPLVGYAIGLGAADRQNGLATDIASRLDAEEWRD